MALPADRMAGRVKQAVANKGRPGGQMANVSRRRRWWRSRLFVPALVLVVMILVLGVIAGGSRFLGWDPLAWAVSLPGVGPLVTTYRMGLQNQADLVEAKKGIAAEMARLEETRRQLTQEEERLQGEALALQQQREELNREKAQLAKDKAELEQLQQDLELRRKIARIYQSMRPADIAAILAARPVDEAAQVILALPAETAGAVLAALNPLRAGMVLEIMQSSGAQAGASGTAGTAGAP